MVCVVDEEEWTLESLTGPNLRCESAALSPRLILQLETIGSSTPILAAWLGYSSNLNITSGLAAASL